MFLVPLGVAVATAAVHSGEQRCGWAAATDSWVAAAVTAAGVQPLCWHWWVQARKALFSSPRLATAGAGTARRTAANSTRVAAARCRWWMPIPQRCHMLCSVAHLLRWRRLFNARHSAAVCYCLSCCGAAITLRLLILLRPECPVTGGGLSGCTGPTAQCGAATRAG